MVNVPDKFLISKNVTPPMGGRGKAYAVGLVTQAEQYYQNMRRVLPSVWNEANRSTNYAIQLRARARELARIVLEQDQVSADVYIDSVRAEFLYRNFGYFLKITDPFFFPEKSDAFYRRFVKSLFQVLFRGSTKAAIEEGLELFLEGIPFTVEQLYLDNIRFGYVPDKRLKNIFAVNLDMDSIPTGVDLNFATKGLEFFLNIIKPAHNQYRVNWRLSDLIDIGAPCTVNFDLLLGDKIALEVIKDPGSSVTITSKVENRLYLSDLTVLFLRDSTVIQDTDENSLLYSDLNPGDAVSFSYVNSTGRIQYLAPFSLIPPDLLTSSLGYIHAPFIADLDTAFLNRSDFLLFAKKLKSHGFDSQNKTSTNLCERLKGSIYTWHYDDFRHCGLPKEISRVDTNVYNTYDPVNKTVRTRYNPIVVGDGSYDLATASDILVEVNGTPALIADINPFLGLITLVNPVPNNATVQVTYAYSENVYYPVTESVDGSYLSHFGQRNVNGLNHYGSVLNERLINDFRKIRYKTSAFILRGSSLENNPATLLHNDPSQYTGKFNQVRLTKNHVEKPCRVNNVNRPLGLNTDGVVLNYPTPPVPLRFDAEARLNNKPILLPDSSVLNEVTRLLNDDLLLNDVSLFSVYSPFINKYAFYDVQTEEVGGTLVPDPFCESLKYRASGTGYSDEYSLPPDIDALHFNVGSENNEIFYGGAYTHLKTRVNVRESFEMPSPEDNGITQMTVVTSFFDTYKNVPANIIIENDAVSDWVGGSPTYPIYGQDPDSTVLNNPNEVLNDSLILNEVDITQIGEGDSDREIVIPPSRVMPGDGLDVVPPNLKGGPFDDNYIFIGKDTFSEELSVNINVNLNDEYVFVNEGMNSPSYVLNNVYDVLNSSPDEIVSMGLNLNENYSNFADDSLVVTITDNFNMTVTQINL